MYIRNLNVKHLRAVTAGHLDLIYPGRVQDKPFVDSTSWPPRLPNVNLLLGVNGAGKSTMLDAIALAVLSPLISQSGYRPYALIKRRKDGTRIAKAQINAELTIHPQDAAALKKNEKLVHRVETVVERRGDVEIVRGTDENNPIWEGMFSDNSPAFLLVGYGATRRVETDAATDSAARYKSRQLRYERVASLFEEHFTLRPLASWLPEWKMKNPGRYRQVITLINKLSTEAIQFTGEIEAGEYLFQSRAAKVPFSALSDGYKAYIGWVGDLLYHVCMGCPNGKRLVDNKGVVLVDEIDLHIHPEWQRTMIPTLAKALPNLQFIFTSHSPLVVGTLERDNIIHVETNRLGNAVVRRPKEEMYGLSADQILRSDMFGLDSTRDPEFKKHLDKLSQQALSGNPDAAMKFMRQAARGSGAIVETLSEASPPDWVKRLTASKDR